MQYYVTKDRSHSFGVLRFTNIAKFDQIICKKRFMRTTIIQHFTCIFFKNFGKSIVIFR